MINIPIAFVIALMAMLMAIGVGYTVRIPSPTRQLLIAFFVSLAVMGGLIGLRYGYGFEQAAQLQPTLAMALTPLLFLSFRSLTEEEPTPLTRLIVRHGWSVFLVGTLSLIPTALPFPIDIFVFASMAFYLVHMIALCRLNQDRFIRVTSDGYRFVVFGLGAGILLIGFVLCSDFAIFISRRLYAGEYSGVFVQVVVLVVTLAMAAILIWNGTGLARRPALSEDAALPSSKMTRRKDDANPSEQALKIMVSLNSLMNDRQLFRDCDLALARTARRLGETSAAVSQAVNQCSHENFSRYINRFRIEYAKNMLETTQARVTDIMLDSGFMTKSNFNAEFSRITGMTPTQYRATFEFNKQQSFEHQ